MKISYRAWSALIERHHRRVLVASLVLCVLSALSLTRLRLDMDVLAMLPQGTPAFDDFKSFVGDFGQLDDLIVEVSGADGAALRAFADEFANRLSALDTVAAVHARVGGLEVWDDLLRRHPFNYLSRDGYAKLAERMTPEGVRAQAAADRRILSAPFDITGARAVQEDPFGIRPLAAATIGAAFDDLAPDLNDGYLMSDDGKALLFFVRPTASAFDIAFSERLMKQVRGAETEVRRDHGAQGLRVQYTGSYVYALEDAATLKSDVTRYVVLALVGVLVVFQLGYRNLRILPFVTYPLAVTTLVTFAVSLFLFDQLNAVSLSFAAILYGLSIDTGIHFYTRFLEEGRDSEGTVDRVGATLSALGRANVVGSATTAAAFLLLAFSCLSAVRQLGILTAFGMLLTSIEFFVLYPALAFWLSPSAGHPMRRLETPRLAAVARRSARHSRAVAVTLGLAGAGLLLAATRVPLDVTLTHLRPRQSEAAAVQDEIETRFGKRGGSGAVLVRRHDLEKALQDAETIAERLHAYEEQGVLDSVQSVETILPSERRQRLRLRLYEELPRRAAVREMREALAEQGFVADRFEEALGELEKPRLDIVRFGDAELAPLRFLIDRYVRVRGADAIVAVYVQPAARFGWVDFADRLHSDLRDMRFQIAARPLLEQKLENVLRRELAIFFALAVVSNAVLISFFFRSFALTAAILAPVLLAATAVFAAMFAMGTALDPVNLVVIPIIFGIGVDDGIYMTARVREVNDVGEAVRFAGRALVMTSLTTVAGFGFLGISEYPPLASMGRLTALGLLACLALSVTLLPALLELLAPSPTSRTASEPVE